MRHFVIAGFLVILAAILTYLGLDAIGLLPPPASAQAVSIDWLWNWEVITISFLFALIVVPLVYSLVVFRRRKGDTTDAEHIEGNTKLEIAWTVVPLFVVMIFAYMGAYSLAETRRADPQAMIINVTASQWAWSFEYPDYGFVSKELHLPKDKQVLLQMQSKDVIHSFWVPEFRVKQDVVPGRVTELRITPTVLTSADAPLKVRCAELCGTSHYSMEEVVIVSEEADFVAWATEQQSLAASAQTPEAKGQLLVTANGCLGCHSIDGSALVGPTWLGVFGREEKLTDGTTIGVNEAYITESILSPQVKIVSGFETQLMPIYTFNEEQIANIIAYLKTLK
jgi:cytochrome c oxidase subunit II